MLPVPQNRDLASRWTAGLRCRRRDGGSWILPALCRGALYLALAVLIGLAASTATRADPPRIVLDGTSGRVTVGDRVEFFEDKDGKITIDGAAAPSNDARFKRKMGAPPSFGFSLSAYWLRFVLVNKTDAQKQWLIEVDHPTLDRLDLYVMKPDGGWTVRTAGDRVPASKREYRHRNIVIPVEIPPGESRTLYVRAVSEGPVRVPLTVHTPENLAAWDRIAQIAFGFNYGVIIIMAIYNIALFFSVRDISHLFFAGFMLSFGAIQMFINGFVYEFLWPENTFFIHVGITVAINIAAIATYYFTRHLLNLRETAPRLDKAMQWTGYAAAGIAVIALFSNILAIRLSYGIMFVTVGYLLAAGIVSWRRGVRQAPYFMLAWSVFIAGILLIALAHLGVLPDNALTIFTIQAGSMIAAVLLSFSVADRIRVMQAEKERALSVSEERYALAMDGAREGLWDWDIRSGFAHFSGRLKAELGLGHLGDSTHIRPREWLKTIHPDDRARYLATLRQHVRGQTDAFECEYRIRAGTGDWVWVLDRGVALRDEKGRAYRMAGSVGNITAMKAKEGELREARDQAEQANAAKSEFLAKMSHELRTPLNAIIGFSEMMVTEALGPVGNTRYKDYAKDISESGSHLLDLINDILDLSKVEAGKLQLFERDMDLKDAVLSALQLVKGRAQEGGLELSAVFGETVPRIRADKRVMKQILLNLLSNAVKFTPRGGHVTIKVAVDTNGGIVLSVADTGIGIHEAEIERITQPFNQIESAESRRHAGTGLGLSLAKSLVEMHDAEMNLRSVEGAGTMVTVRFPPERTLAPIAPADNHETVDRATAARPAEPGHQSSGAVRPSQARPHVRVVRGPPAPKRQANPVPQDVAPTGEARTGDAPTGNAPTGGATTGGATTGRRAGSGDPPQNFTVSRNEVEDFRPAKPSGRPPERTLRPAKKPL